MLNSTASLPHSHACVTDLESIQRDFGRHFCRWLLIGLTILAPLTLLRDMKLGTQYAAIHLASYAVVLFVWFLRGRLRPDASVVALLAVVYVQGLCAMASYGGPAQGFLAFALVVLAGAITLGTRAGVVAGLACVVALVGGAWAKDPSGPTLTWVTGVARHDPGSWLYAALAMACFAAIVLSLVRLATRHMEMLIGREVERSSALQSVNQDLIEANSKLTSLNNELEHRVEKRTADLAAANVTLAQNAQYLEMFAYSVSHDLRAPLRAIGGFSRLLEEELGGAPLPAVRRFLQHIHKGVETAENMIARLLRFAQLGRVDKHVERICLSRIASTVVDELRAASPERSVTIEIDQEMNATADPLLVRQLLQNLLGNCWKFTEPQPNASVRFGSREEMGRRVYLIADNGVGFDAGDAKKLFLPFQRLHAAASFDGTGIGLVSARRIVELHGGQIWAEGRRGEGATFFFTLPPAADDSRTEDLHGDRGDHGAEKNRRMKTEDLHRDHGAHGVLNQV